MPNERKRPTPADIRNQATLKEAQLSIILKKRDEFEAAFNKKYLSEVEIPYKGVNDGYFLSENDISDLEKRAPNHGFSSSEVQKFKKLINQQKIHDLRGEGLDDAQIEAIRALEYKETYDAQLNQRIEKIEAKIAKYNIACENLAKAEEERLASPNKTAEIDVKIAKLAQEAGKTAAALNKSLETLNKELTSVNSADAQINKNFYDGFITYFKATKEIDNFIDKAIDDFNKQKQQAKEDSEKKQKAEKEKEEANKIAEAKAAIKRQYEIDNEAEKNGYYSDVKFIKARESYVKGKLADVKLENVIKTTENLLKDENEKLVFENFIKSMEENYDTKLKFRQANFEKEYTQNIAIFYKEGRDMFEKSSAPGQENNLDISKKLSEIENKSITKQIFNQIGMSPLEKDNLLKTMGYLQSAHEYLNSLTKPNQYNGPNKADYKNAYVNLSTYLSNLDDKLINQFESKDLGKNMVHKMNDKVECKKDFEDYILTSALKEQHGRENSSVVKTINASIKNYMESYKNDALKNKLEIVYDAYDKIKEGKNKDLFESLSEKTITYKKDTASYKDDKSDVNKEQKVVDGKNKLDTYAREAQKYEKKSWFSKLFDRKGKAALARQREALKRDYGFNDTQLDLAKYGSQLDAKKLGKIIAQADKTKENANLISEAINDYNIKDVKTTNAFKQSFENLLEAAETNTKENISENRKHIILEEIKDGPHSKIQNELENSNSINLENSKEQETISKN